ncbi:MAG: DUF1674 domain-containing protein [Woeseiaceae bacterium]
MSQKPEDTAKTYKPNGDGESVNGVSKETPVSGEHSKEIGGRDGPEPTRFGDWEKNGRCIDF